MYSQLTQSAFAFSYDVFIPDFLMAGLAVKPGSEIYIQSLRDRGNVKL